MDALHDVIIIGGGFGGSLLGMILARRGYRALILEREAHPRFALGEAGIRETSLTLAALARRHDLPELRALASARGVRRAVGPTSGQKESFSFLWHAPGERHRPRHTVQVGSPPFPFGPDAHYFRADVDDFLARRAAARGAALLVGAQVVEVEAGSAGAAVTLADGRRFRGRFLVDGGGASSPLGRALGLFEEPPEMATSSRAIFTHLRGVAPCDERVASAAACGVPQRLASGTVHHLFPGGWVWVIPFDNLPGGVSDLCSVGVCLDTRAHPATDLSPEAEVAALFQRLPSVARHLEGARLARPWVGVGRMQRRARQLVGEGWALAPHAAGFVDPLFSRGLYLTAAGVGSLAEALCGALEAGDLSPARFSGYERLVRETLAANDALVSASYQAAASFELFNAWHRIWALGAFYQSLRLTRRLLDPGAGGAGGDGGSAGPWASLPFDIPGYAPLFDGARALVEAAAAGAMAPEEAAAGIFALLKASEATPSPLSYAEPDRRYLASTGPRANLALRRWGLRADAPPELSALFDYPLSAVVLEGLRVGARGLFSPRGAEG